MSVNKAVGSNVCSCIVKGTKSDVFLQVAR